MGAGDERCVLLLIGTRTPDAEIVYPRSELALQHGAGVEEETRSPDEAYSRFPETAPTPYRKGWLRRGLVGAAGFEPAISRPQSERDTRLRYAPDRVESDRTEVRCARDQAGVVGPNANFPS